MVYFDRQVSIYQISKMITLLILTMPFRRVQKKGKYEKESSGDRQRNSD